MPVLTYADGDDPEESETPAVTDQQWQGDNQDNMGNWDSWDSWDNSWDTDNWDNWTDSWDTSGDTDDANSWDSGNDWDNTPQISNTLLSSPAPLLMNTSAPDTDNQDNWNEQNDNNQSVTDSNSTSETPEQYLNRCYEYEYNDAWTLILSKYLCDETNIVIPTSGSWDDKYTSVKDWTFLWKTVESVVFPQKVNVWSYAFSWATFVWNITIDPNVSWNYPFGFTVAENSVLTFKNYISQMYYVDVNWKIVYDITDYRNEHNIPSMGVTYLLDKSRINWEVEVKWFSWTMTYSFMDSEITENGKVVIWEWINHITSYSFWWEFYDWGSSVTNWTIVFPESLEQITYSFNETEINWNLVFPSSLNKLYNSFRYSVVNSDMVFQSEGEPTNFNLDSSFWYSTLWWDLIFSWLTIYLNNISPRWISWDLSFINTNFTYLYNLFTLWNEVVSWSINFINTDLNLNWWYFFQATNILWDFNVSWNTIKLSSGIPVALKIKWSLNITWDNIKLPWFTWSQISWDVNISWNTIDLMYGFNDSKIDWDFTIYGKDIVAKYGSLNRLKIGGDVLITWDDIDFYVDVFNNTTIDWDFTIDAGLLEAMYSVLNYLNVLWDLKLPENSSFWQGVLWWYISKNNKVIAAETTVSIWDTVNNATLDNWVQIVADELDDSVVQTTDNVTTVQDKEIVVSSGKVAEYQWWLEITFHDQTDNNKIEWTAKFSAPISVKVPVNNTTTEYVKVRVKHAWDEEFWFTGLTLNQHNECEDGEPKLDKYNWEDVLVEEKNGERFVVIYTCSASTFVAYSEGDPYVPSNNSGIWWGGSGVVKTPAVEKEEHNSADVVEEKNEAPAVEKTEESKVEAVKETKKKATRVEEQNLTRWEVAVMTNILLEVYPQLIEGREEVNWIGAACHSYTDEKDFTDNEKRAITKLCRLSIMGIHKENNVPLEEFMVSRNIYNDEFAAIVNRIVDQYTEKDFTEIKEVLSKLEGDESDMEFGTLYSVFMSIKKLFD